MSVDRHRHLDVAVSHDLSDDVLRHAQVQEQRDACVLPLAEDTYLRMRRVLGEDHPDTLTAAGSLVGLFKAVGNSIAALVIESRILKRAGVRIKGRKGKEPVIIFHDASGLSTETQRMANAPVASSPKRSQPSCTAEPTCVSPVQPLAVRTDKYSGTT